MGVSRRKFASLRGVSEAAVRAAITSGRITVEADGTIDPEKAMAQWDSQTDPSKQRGPLANALRAQEQQRTRAASMKPVTKDAVDAVNELAAESGMDPDPNPASGELTFARAKMADLAMKIKRAKLAYDRDLGKLVDRAKARSDVFDLARRERDAWLNWPPRVAANMAADMGVDPHLLEQTLDRYLRAHLAEMAEVKLELR